MAKSRNRLFGDIATNVDAATGRIDSASLDSDIATTDTSSNFSSGLQSGGVDVAADANLNSFLTAFDLPTADGTSGQYLKTNGSGTLGFQSLPGNATTTTDGFMSSSDKTKLDGVETGATADQTAAEIKTAYESNSDTNAFTDALQTKLNGIETSADVTDAANVAAAGAVMESDTTTASMSFVVDEDDMISDLATKVPTQQSVKAYVDAQVATKDALSELSGTLDDISDGTTYKRFSATEQTKLSGIETGATADQTDAEIKTAYENNADTNAFTDALQTKLNGIEASADVTDTDNVTSAGAVMDSELTDETAVKAINQGLATTDSPSFANATTTGEVNVGTHIDLAIQSAHASYQEGRMWYDSIHKTINFYSDDQNVIHEIGLEEHQRVYNNTGSTISKGKPLYFSGNYTAGSIDVPTVGLADATDVNAYNAQGLAAADIPNNSYGYCIIAGQLDGIDTSGLTAGTNFFVGLSPGAVQNASPTYPNYPMCLGWVVNSDATNGVLLVNQQNHSVRSFRVQTDAHVGDDLIVGGNLTVQGTTTTTSSNNVELGASFQYLNAGDTIGASGTSQTTGSGLDDATFTGHFTGTASTTYYVKIDATGTPDTFSWSKDNFSTTEATGVAITGNDQSLDNGISINFGATTGHTLNDVWSGTAAPSSVDTGLFTNRNTGSSGVGYTHMGLFFDASTEKWTLLDEYDPEPTGTINLADASTSYATLKAGTFEGALIGNVTGDVSGNATTATTLATARTIGGVSFDGSANIDLPGVNTAGNQNTTGSAATLTTARTISLTGDVTGSVTFDGSADVSITATVGDDSHDHTNATTSADGFMSSTDKTKLDGIATSANNYTHPNHTGEVTSTADGATVVADDVIDEANLKVSNAPTNGYFLQAQSAATGGLTWAAVPAGYADSDVDTHLNQSSATTNQILSWNGSDYAWVDDSDTTYSNATTSVAGLMSASDKTKLDTVATNADVTPSWVPSTDPSYLTSGGDASFANVTATSTAVIDGFTLQDSADRSGLLALTTSLGTWRGIQIQPTTTSKWSIMGDQDDFGLYDDQNNEWILLYNENSTLQLYSNGTNSVSVTADGLYLSSGAKNITFEGNNNDANETVLSTVLPEQDALVLIPNEDGILALESYVDAAEARVVGKAVAMAMVFG